MKQNKTKRWVINIAIILIVLALIGILLAIKNSPNQNTTKEIAQCIGQKSTLYTQLGCHACGIQENMFGENYQYLNVVDCWHNHEKCVEKVIEYTPTWIINEEKVIGVQSIEKLQELTGC